MIDRVLSIDLQSLLYEAARGKGGVLRKNFPPLARAYSKIKSTLRWRARSSKY